MYAIVNCEATLEAALKLAKGSYQCAILRGSEALSGATLRGRVASYSGNYKASSRNLLRRCQAAGLNVREQVGDHNKRLVVIG